MKKFSKCVGKKSVSLMTLVVVFCCAMAASMFSACSSSSDDDNNKVQDSGKATGARVSVVFQQTEDMLKYCDISVEYTGADKPEKITETSWQKTLDAKLPTTFTLKKTVTLKDGVDLSAIASINITDMHGYGYCLLNASSSPLSTLSILSAGSSGTISGTKFAAYLEKGSFNKTITYTFDANGNRTK